MGRAQQSVATEWSRSDFPRSILAILEEVAAGGPVRLYLLHADGTAHPVYDSGLEVEETLEVELTSSDSWTGGVRKLEHGFHAVTIEWRDEPVGGVLFPGREASPLSEESEESLAIYLQYQRESLRSLSLGGLRDAIDSALPFGFLTVDALGRVLDIGGKAEAILGVSRNEVLGRDCARVLRPVSLSESPLLRALRQPEGPLELFIRRPDGEEIPIRLQMSRHDHDDGSPFRLHAFFQDLSEERRHEEADRQKERLAVLGELSAGVAHEIRNPLTGIANGAQVLLEDLDPDHKGQRFIRIILDETDRLNRIVEGLLGYARPNRPQMCSGQIEDSLKRVLELTRAELEESGIRVDDRVRGRIPRLFFDPGQIEQVLLNLIRNSRDAMSGGGALTIRTLVVRRSPYRRRGPGRRSTDKVRRVGEAPKQRFVQIRIEDTGGGIPKEFLDRIWNPFFTTRPRGTGLGLSLSQSIVQAHGGFLSLRPVDNKGTTAILDLPIERRQGERRRDDD